MKPLATLGDLMNWRAELRSNGVPTRPPPSQVTADRGHVEQPGEKREPPPRRVVIPTEALEREQLEALAEELGEPSPYEEKKPPALVATKPSAFVKPAPAPVAENDSEEEAEPGETIVKGHKYSLEFKAKAVARVMAGETARGVAAALGTSEQNISLWVKKAQREAGVPLTDRRDRRIHPDSVRVTAVQRVLDGGETQSAVVDSLSLAPSVVSRWVNQERERRESMNAKESRKKPTYIPPKVKLEAVRRVRELQAQNPGRMRGIMTEVGDAMGLDRQAVAGWCASGNYEPDPKAPETKTMMSRPEPQPMSQPASTTQPMTVQPLQYHPAPPMPYPPQPPAPPPWWNQQPPAAPPSAPAVSAPMVGLEEYIKRMVAHEMELQLPAAVQAALTKMWGQR